MHDRDQTSPIDEGGLRAPPGLSPWRKAWWWFDFLILVKLARLRFIAVLAAIGLVITQWDTLLAYYDRWTRSASAASADGGLFEWFCPMHPTIIRDNPKDKCPICFMPLSKRSKGTAHTDPLPPGTVSRVQLSPYRVVLAGIQTWPVDYMELVKEISAVGYVEFNERGQRTVSARVNGRIDKLLVNETGQLVQAEDDLALLYSPELLVTQQNLLDARRSGNREMLASSRTRLQLLGISDNQIDEILTSGKPVTHFKIRSPIGGHVIQKFIREGQYVQEGMALYEVADLSTVWISASVYEDDLAFLPTQQEHRAVGGSPSTPTVSATTRAFPNEPFKGKLAFIYPHVDQATRTVTVRFELENPGHKLRPGSSATITLTVRPKEMAIFIAGATDETVAKELAAGRVLAVPDVAVIDTGSQAIVYREATPGVYEGVEVKLGPRMSDSSGVLFYPVLRGLAAGERIVTAGSFLVDAETRLNPAAGSIYFGGSGAKPATAGTTTRPSTPDDPEKKIKASLAKLTPADRRLAETQRFCPVLEGSRLGSMGPPVKLLLENQTAFVCCAGCKPQAMGNPKETIEKIGELEKKTRKAASGENP